MAASRADVDRWIATGIENNDKYIVSVCDTFDHDDYPVYCKDEEKLEAAKIKYDNINMQRINEVIVVADFVH